MNKRYSKKKNILISKKIDSFAKKGMKLVKQDSIIKTYGRNAHSIILDKENNPYWAYFYYDRYNLVHRIELYTIIRNPFGRALKSVAYSEFKNEGDGNYELLYLNITESDKISKGLGEELFKLTEYNIHKKGGRLINAEMFNIGGRVPIEHLKRFYTKMGFEIIDAEEKKVSYDMKKKIKIPEINNYKKNSYIIKMKNNNLRIMLSEKVKETVFNELETEKYRSVFYFKTNCNKNVKNDDLFCK